MKIIASLAIVVVSIFFLSQETFWQNTSEVTFFEPDVSLLAPPPPPEETLVKPKSEAATSTQPKKENIKPVPPAPAPTPTSPLTLPKPPRVKIPEDIIYKRGTSSVVNILCPQGSDTYSVGTGVVINDRGYILSNAHIADEYTKKEPCTVRRGSPATQFTKAELVFIPQAYKTSVDERIRAEYDISLWKITDATTTMPYWSFDFDNSPVAGEVFLTLSYPAELLSDDIIFKNLWLSFSNTTVKASDSTILSSEATLSAQHGSSGGILVDPYTMLIRGLIFGIDSKAAIADRQLFSLLPNTINAAFKKEKGLTLREYLSLNP